MALKPLAMAAARSGTMVASSPLAQALMSALTDSISTRTCGRTPASWKQSSSRRGVAKLRGSRHSGTLASERKASVRRLASLWPAPTSS